MKNINNFYSEKIELASKNVSIELYPSINYWGAEDTIRVDFGKKEWHFKEFGSILENDALSIISSDEKVNNFRLQIQN